MTDTVYYILCGMLTAGILAGISMMSRVRTAAAGNLLSAGCMGAAVLATLLHHEILAYWQLWLCMAAGLVPGLIWAARIKMIEMPQIVALFNGFGGAASALVAMVTLSDGEKTGAFGSLTAALALAVGMVTLTGSLIAAGKLSKLLPQKPVVWKGHRAVTTVTLLLTVAAVVISGLTDWLPVYLGAALLTLLSAFFGVAFAVRVGGADMPITISLLNSLSGVAGSVAGMAVEDPLLVAVGGIVGASGLLLTQIMCRAMNRSLADILLGKTSAAAKPASEQPEQPEKEEPPAGGPELVPDDPAEVLRGAKDVILVPGYGMALAQAQQLVKELADRLEANGARVRFAIHPVAGRMPGHMNVLLCEVDVPYEKLFEMEAINSDFESCDAAVVVGANDVLNPAARSAEGTPIYGMPVLAVDKAKHVIICNYDLKPGYAGVENPLYSRKEGVTLLLGDAKETLRELIDRLKRQTPPGNTSE